MPYQDIVTAIRNAATSVNTSGTFIHARRTDGSIEYNSPMPQIHLYPFNINIDAVNNFDSSDIYMGFWFQDKPDSSNEERETMIAQADDLLRDFLNALLSGKVQASNIRTEPAYRALSATLSGFVLRFTLITKNNVCV